MAGVDEAACADDAAGAELVEARTGAEENSGVVVDTGENSLEFMVVGAGWMHRDSGKLDRVNVLGRSVLRCSVWQCSVHSDCTAAPRTPKTQLCHSLDLLFGGSHPAQGLASLRTERIARITRF